MGISSIGVSKYYDNLGAFYWFTGFKHYWEICKECKKLTHRRRPHDGWSYSELRVNTIGPLCLECYEKLLEEWNFKNLIIHNN